MQRIVSENSYLQPNGSFKVQLVKTIVGLSVLTTLLVIPVCLYSGYAEPLFGLEKTIEVGISFIIGVGLLWLFIALT